MLYTGQRTIFGIQLNLAQLTNKEYKIHANSTLNQHLDINQDINHPEGKYPYLGYYCIGVGGIGSIGENTTDYPFSQHSATDANLFKLMPFILRTENNDIEDAYKKKYRLRKIIEVNSIRYIAYYLRSVDMDTEVNYSDEIMQVNNYNGTSVLDVISTDSDFLSPQPINKKNNLITDTSSFVVSNVKFIINLDSVEIEEINNVMNILAYNKKITEIGLCTGYDLNINGSIEAVSTQIAFHVGMTIELAAAMNEKSIHRIIEVGGQCPMLT